MFGLIITMFAGCASVIYMFWCLLRAVFVKERRSLYLKRSGFGFLALLASFILFSVVAVVGEINTAHQAGFDGLSDYQSAKKAGISDPSVWKAKKEELLKAQIAVETARKAEAEKAAADAQAEIKKIAAAKVAEEERLRAEEERKKKDAAAACLADLACVWKEQSVYMSAECKVAVQRLAKWDYEWTDGWTDRAFRPVWLEKDNGLVLLSGDKLKLQNGFGAWKHVSYLCTYNPAIKQAVSASVVE